MFVELLEKLRCPNQHEPSVLVGTASRTVDRHIVDGTLGCPVCHAEFRIRDGVLDLGGAGARPLAQPHPLAEKSPRTGAWPAADGLGDHMMLRTGALLGLDERGGLYVLGERCARYLPGLAELSPNSLFVALSGGGRVEGAAAVICGHGDVLPLAPACARGIALDRANQGLVESAVAVLASGGRLVAPADAIVPRGITVLARDDEQWVGEKEAVPVVSAIRRAPR